MVYKEIVVQTQQVEFKTMELRDIWERLFDIHKIGQVSSVSIRKLSITFTKIGSDKKYYSLFEGFCRTYGLKFSITSYENVTKKGSN